MIIGLNRSKRFLIAFFLSLAKGICRRYQKLFQLNGFCELFGDAIVTENRAEDVAGYGTGRVAIAAMIDRADHAGVEIVNVPDY